MELQARRAIRKKLQTKEEGAKTAKGKQKKWRKKKSDGLCMIKKEKKKRATKTKRWCQCVQ